MGHLVHEPLDIWSFIVSKNYRKDLGKLEYVLHVFEILFMIFLIFMVGYKAIVLFR